MRKITGFSLIPMLALLLASCGGGGGGTDLMPPAIADSSLKVASATGMVMTASQSPQRTSTSAGLSSTQLFDWAESRYPAYFPGHQANQVWAPYTYRYYPATQAYLGVDGAVVRVFGPVFGPDIVTVGTLNQFVCDVTPQNCLAPTANATAASTAVPGSVVTLDGRASADPKGEALTFTWSLTRAYLRSGRTSTGT